MYRVHQLGQPAGAGDVAGVLGEQVALHLDLRPHVLGYQRPELGLQLAAPEQAYGRDLQPLLEYLPHPEGHRAGRESPHVDVVRLVGGDGDHLALVEDGGDEAQVVEVAGARRVGHVHRHRVTGVQVVEGVRRHRRPDRRLHRAQVQGRAYFALGHHYDVAGGGVDRAGCVAAVLDVRRVARADKGNDHLVSDRVEGVAHDLQGDRVDLHRPRSSSRFLYPSTDADCSGQTSVVESSCSMTAGPSTTSPGASFARSYMRASTGCAVEVDSPGRRFGNGCPHGVRSTKPPAAGEASLRGP